MSHDVTTTRIEAKKSFQLYGTVLLLCLVSVAAVGQEPQGPLLLRPSKEPASQAKSAAVIRSESVDVDFQLLRDPENRVLRIPLFGHTITLVRERIVPTTKTGFVWYGHTEREPGSTAMLSVSGEALVATIVLQEGRVYQIRHVRPGLHAVEEIDQSKLPEEKAPTQPKYERPRIEPNKDMAKDTCATDPATDIDVLVVYTAAARAGAGSTDAMEATVYLALEETNQSYINSNINQRLRLAHMEEIAYTESGNSTTDKTRLQNPADGILDYVPTLRNTFAADAVVMITETLDACGESFIMNPVANTFEPFAYAVVMRNGCATGNYSFGHELGHVMSARHDWTADPTNNSPYAYDHGHLNTAPTATGTGAWRTVMAYNSSCVSTAGINCTRLMYWSNPNVSYPPGVTPNDPMGLSTGNQTNNTQTLNNTALTVANFRCSSPGVGNVWMKDTWNDTGKEPDPNTTNDIMWNSPYIWVRNTQDTNLTHQHEHQNPELGSANFVYVKMHNGGSTAASGNLELYFANASTSLNWPTAWTLLSTVPVTSFAAHSTRVVEATWSSLPGTGHYCLVARWVSGSDPMAVTEGPDIGANTRNNNNIVWRNLNIVDLVHDESSDVSLTVRNSGRDREITSLVIRVPKDQMAHSFLQTGQVDLELDDALFTAWRQPKSAAKTFRNDGRYVRILGPQTVTLEGFVLPPKFEGHLKIRFQRLPATPRRSFQVDVMQVDPGRPEPIGGVSYEIHTDEVSR